MSTPFLFTGPDDAATTILLAHGSGAPMDSASMNAAAAALAEEGLRIARFEFPYMAARRTEGSRRPPPKAETLNPAFRAAVEALAAKGKLVVGGRSMGGRVASMVADALFAEGRIAGLLCLGYPFHPPEKPTQLRTAHLMALKTPTLICQGTRDPFGTKDEVPTYGLPASIRLLWLEDGDHDLKPRKSISGFSAADHLTTMARTVKAWTETL
ncbi:alpha/beta family hydrolase [Sinorhizobium sp. RAC02]|uniref:alpha/beta hydrolase family protein n=1 Tax=Sinorhizobium sp. RAC02 TaxID=1842534 RepID=UPI00083DCB24|nr:alpha/beta family hydrolase [Sinorhizobium sp. RAC02]AOF90758.1 alpha/beta hydrolase family protein [Sinorhizobium sp. RAC02]